MELLHPLTKWTSPQLCATVEAAVSERKVLQTVVSARAADGGAAPTAFFLSLAPFDYHRTQLWAVMLVALGGDALSWNSGAGAGGGGAGALLRTTKEEVSSHTLALTLTLTKTLT